MFLIDTHTHLYSSQFDEDREEMVQRAFDAGVKQMLLPNIDLESIQGMKDLVAAHPDAMYPMMGLHPCSVKADFQEVLATLKAELENGEYIAVGEMGMDLYWDKTFLEEQKEAFRIQIEWAKEKGLPVVLHVRDAFDETLSLLDELNDDRLTGVFHCFTGTEEHAQHIDGYGGFYFGIGGVVTFKNGGVDKVLPSIDRSKIILETDSPYLAPKPHRGKRNESAYTQLVAQRSADVLEMSIDELAALTTTNAQRLFNI
ncbi:TatD family hydrolase [Sanyastnella coralliicola]|uniref:TatD family hydrolase n=1 Tax=Sanyastnella coralliicola TaxID=3069118 RepID=UPI0027B8A855|nr:TatD family hydrolase [Longitalea sp. SCSIO 12813]